MKPFCYKACSLFFKTLKIPRGKLRTGSSPVPGTKLTRLKPRKYKEFTIFDPKLISIINFIKKRCLTYVKHLFFSKTTYYPREDLFALLDFEFFEFFLPISEPASTFVFVLPEQSLVLEAPWLDLFLPNI